MPPAPEPRRSAWRDRTVSAIAQTHVYTDAPGVVARCPGCGGVMLRLVRGPGRAWLDLRGITCLQLALPGQP